jgi:hypothetical protein
MRDLANAALRLSWAIPLFGMKQMLDLMTFQTATMADALNRVTNFAITPPATTQSANSIIDTAKNQIKQKDDMSEQLTFTNDEFALVEYKIFFTMRDLECCLDRGEVVVTKAMDQSGFIAWRIAEFVSKMREKGIDRPAKWEKASYPPGSPSESPPGYMQGDKVTSLPPEDYQYLRCMGVKSYVSPRESGNYQERQTKAIEEIAANTKNKIG